MRRGFVIHFNGPPADCIGQPHSRCERFWSAVRDYHVNTKGWSDIAYSFGVCPHGTRFEGRGWDKRQWANGSDQVGPDDGADRDWYTVLAFIGQGEKPTDDMVQGVRDLIAEGRDWGRCMDRVLPHNAFKRKACPGPEFTALAKAWDNQPFTTPQPPVQEDDMLQVIVDGNVWLIGLTAQPINLGGLPSVHDQLVAQGVKVITGPHAAKFLERAKAAS